MGEQTAGSGIPKVAELGNIGGNLQHCVIFCNRNSTKTREPLSKWREPGSK